MENSTQSALESTKDDSNICSTCGGLDNTIHLCSSNRFTDPQIQQHAAEYELKKTQKELDRILSKLRDARRESYAYVGQVSEAERHLKLMLKGREFADTRLEQLTKEALSKSMRVIDLLRGVPEDQLEDSGYSFNVTGTGND